MQHPDEISAFVESSNMSDSDRNVWLRAQTFLLFAAQRNVNELADSYFTNTELATQIKEKAQAIIALQESDKASEVQDLKSATTVLLSFVPVQT
jgi:rhamnogalacturonyl hydrolase YesR